MTFSSQWEYPSPMNYALRDTFYHEAGGAGLITHQIPIQRFIASALPNLILHARQNQENSKNAFGREDLPIHVDDNIRPSWVIVEDTATTPAIDKVQLDCMMCTKGTEGYGIFSACGDYTETPYLQSTSQLITVTSSSNHHHQLTIPPFSPSLNLPTHACGICVLTTCPHTLCTNQHTIPFPILASRRPNNQPLTFRPPKQVLHPRLYVKPKSSRASSSRSSNSDKPSTTILIIIIPIALLLAFFIVFARRMRKVKMQSQPQLQSQWQGPVRVRREEQGRRERSDGDATDIRYSASVLPLSREDEFGRVATPDLQVPPPSYYEAMRGQGRRG